MGKAFSNFDMYLVKGEVGEQFVKSLFKEELKIEVKTDYKWKETGNVYIETSCWKNKSQSWEPSGIYAPELDIDLFSVVLEGAEMSFPPDSLRYAVEEHGTPVECNIQPNPTKGVLITPSLLWRAHREHVRNTE